MANSSTIQQAPQLGARFSSRTGNWARRTLAIIVVLVIVGILELAQHLMVTRIPLYYHHLTGVIQGALVIGLVILYLRWRYYALYVQDTLENLRQAERWRDDMTAMLVHDLKNPVISSTLALQAILRRQKNAACLSDQEMEYLRMAQQSQVRLSNMIGDLMTIAQAESGSIPLQLERVDMCAITTRVVQEMTHQAERAELLLTHSCGDPVRLVGDRFRLRRVVENLLANAIKFTPAGGQISVAVEYRGNMVQLRVSDTGKGISPAAQELIFHKFGQAETGSRMSIGLGLTFCKLIAEAHGGRISVESEPGMGSTFIVTLPSRLSEEERQAGAGPQARKPEPTTPRFLEDEEYDVDDVAHRAGDDRP